MLTIEQEKVVNHGKGNILVSASAGSGKTHTMIERAIRLITEEKVGVNEILCVTFTEKAAFEMKERLKKALVEIIEKTDDKHLKEQLSEIATSDISTLHAFCARLIRSHFFVAGCAPDFKILEEGDATVLKYKCIEKTFKEFYDSQESWFCTLIDRHATSRSDKKFKETVLEAYAFINSEAEPERLMGNSLFQYTQSGFSALLSEFKHAFDVQILRLKNQVEQTLLVFEVANFKKGTDFANALLSDMNAVLSENNLYKFKAYEDYKLPASFGKITDETIKEQKDFVMSLRDEFIKLCKRFFKCVGNSFDEDLYKNQNAGEHTKWFFKVLKRFSEIYSEEKREENVLDFNDLEHFALKILQDEQVLLTVKGKYKYIFVDEYQDTNGVQESIIDKIQSDNVFMVGDVKQSIYGFRGCRSEFFIYKDKLMTAKGQAVVRLNKNFRSAKKVIDMVNGIFSYCMTDSVYGENYRGRSELIYGGTYDEKALGRAELHVLERAELQEKEQEVPRIYDILQEKPTISESHTAYTCALVAKIINDELEKEIYDAKEKRFRRANFGDVCLLTRSRDSEYVRDLISGLVGRGVPVESDTEVNVLDYAEIKMLVNVLKLIDCFSQDVALVSTLKSPIANLTDEELMDIAVAFRDDKKRGNFFEAYSHYIANYQGALKDKLLKFDNYFNQLRFLSDFLGAHGILQKIISENNFKGYMLASANGNDKLARVNRFVSASIVNDKKLTVKELLNRIEVCPKAFGLSEFSSENTVKAMTIHSSKGLEFPIVIVCGLERAFNTEDDSKDILFDRRLGFAVRNYRDENRVKEDTVLRGVIRENARLERVKEEARLFYVATTRAQYSLHLVCSVKEDKRKNEFTGASSFLDFIPLNIPTNYYNEQDFSLYSQIKQTRKVLIGRSDKEKEEQMFKCFNYEYPFLSDTKLPLKYSVTNAVKEQKEEFYPTYVLVDNETTDVEKGNIAHKFLEHYDFYSNDDVNLQAQRILESGAITKKELEKINLLRIEKAINSGVFENLKNAVFYREKSFLVQVPANMLIDSKSKEKVLLQGIIDLLAVKDNEAYIIDYKYSALDEKSLKARYQKQLNLYAFAVESAIGIKVKGMALINLFTGDTILI